MTELTEFDRPASPSPDQRQARYDARLAAVEQAVARLPDVAQEVARRWRRCVEMCGKHGADGCALRLVEDFVADLALVVDTVWEMAAARKATPDHATRTGGW